MGSLRAMRSHVFTPETLIRCPYVSDSGGWAGRSSPTTASSWPTATRRARFVENLGYYKPLAHPARLVIDLERVDYWLSEGADPSATMKSLIAKARAGGDETVAIGAEDAEEQKAKRAEELAAKRAAEEKAAAEAAAAEAATEEAAADEAPTADAAAAESVAEEAEPAPSEADAEKAE